MPLSRGDKKLHITFNEMGHGDNVLISLPNGKMMVIDCGTMRWDRNYWVDKPPVEVLRDNAVKAALGDARFLLNNKDIDLLVLTHPDKDHCSELSNLFIDLWLFPPVDGNNTGSENPPEAINYKRATKAAQVFYSETFSTYGNHGVPHVLLTWEKADAVYALTINLTENSYSKVTAHNYKGTTLDAKNIAASAKDSAEILKKSDVAATKNFVKILDGSSDDGIACGVYFLASNVEPYANLADNSSQDNRGSIVTMIVYGDKKFLFLGDSTFHTERFLMETYGDLIKDVEVLHIPHHGSYSTSSSAAFAAHVNPRYAVVTAAWDSGPKLALPRYEILDRYHKGSRLLNKANDVEDFVKKINCYQYKSVTEDVINSSGDTVSRTAMANALVKFDAPKHLWCTGSHGAIDFDYQKTGDGTVDRIV